MSTNAPSSTPTPYSLLNRILKRIKTREYPNWPPAAYKWPTFKEYLRCYWDSFLSSALFGLLSIGLLLLMPLISNRLIHRSYLDGTLPTYAYPFKPDVWGICPIWLSTLLSLGLPILIYLILFLWTKSYWDTNNAIWGTSMACLAASLIDVILKFLVGGPRPFFVDVCDPDFSNAKALGSTNMMFLIRDVCRGATLHRGAYITAMQSFPSGHTATGFAGLGFLSLYLRAKLRVGSTVQQPFWKYLAVLTPLILASWIGLAICADHVHHWWDVLAGAVIGLICAVLAYSNMFRAVWDSRWNHVPVVPGKFLRALEEKEKGREQVQERKQGAKPVVQDQIV